MLKGLFAHGFLRLNVVNMLVCVACCVMQPFLLFNLFAPHGVQGALFAPCFCLGLLALAPFCNYWVDAYPRKGVALHALFVLAASVWLYLLQLPLWGMLAVCVLQGAAMGVLQIVMGSTLLIDLSESGHRTDAAHIYYWVMRLCFALGPMLFLYVHPRFPLSFILGGISGILFLAWLLLTAVHVPFRAPLEPRLVSCDRFWLKRGWRIFIPFFLTAMGIALMLGALTHICEYLLVLLGLCIALVSHVFFFKRHLQVEIFVGYLFLCLSAVAQFEMPQSAILVLLLLGWGAGLVCSRYLLSYLRVCQHCERATAQSSYFLAWQCGTIMGFGLFYYLEQGERSLPVAGLPVEAFLIATVFHALFVCRWYARVKRK